MTPDQALHELRELGFADATLTGEETPLSNGETLLGYTTEHTFDQPILVRSADGKVRVESWTYRFGLE